MEDVATWPLIRHNGKQFVVILSDEASENLSQLSEKKSSIPKYMHRLKESAENGEIYVWNGGKYIPVTDFSYNPAGVRAPLWEGEITFTHGRTFVITDRTSRISVSEARRINYGDPVTQLPPITDDKGNILYLLLDDESWDKFLDLIDLDDESQEVIRPLIEDFYEATEEIYLLNDDYYSREDPDLVVRINDPEGRFDAIVIGRLEIPLANVGPFSQYVDVDAYYQSKINEALSG